MDPTIFLLSIHATAHIKREIIYLTSESTMALLTGFDQENAAEVILC